MADGPYGAAEIVIDLTVTAARVIKDISKHEWVKYRGIRINGVSGAGDGSIVLRRSSASGPVVFRVNVAAGQTVDGTMQVGSSPLDGLYMDALPVAWTANSHMIIYTL